MAARRVTCAFAAAMLLWAPYAAAASQSQSIAVRDARSAQIALDRPAARIVSLAPHLTELTYAAGAGRALVGAALFSDYPEAAKSLPHIGDATRVDIERVLALKPDLVLAWKSGNPAADVARLERLGMRVHVSEAARLADVPGVMRAIGELAGTAAAADVAARAFEETIAGLRARHAGDTPVRVFYQIWDRPLLTVSGRHIISDVLALCGGTNVFAATPFLTPSVSLEALIAARPHAVLGGSSGMSARDFEAQWRARDVAALGDIAVRYVPPDVIQRPTPRIAEGARLICDHLDAVRSALRLR